MGKEIVVVLGSPRRNGNTDQMADAFIKGAEKAGNRVTKIYTQDLDTGCVGCGGCFRSESQACCMHPDFNAVASALQRADGIVFASPLYWYDMPGKLKCFIDNFFCFFAAGKDMAHKKTAMLCCGEEKRNYLMFEGIQRTYELICKIQNWSIVEQIYVPGVLNAGEIRETGGLRRAEALGLRFF